jgi:hypothetical protein
MQGGAHLHQHLAVASCRLVDLRELQHIAG